MYVHQATGWGIHYYLNINYNDN